MSLFKKFFSKKEEEKIIATEANTIYSPITGTIIPIQEIDDGVFSEEVLGKGCGIIPSDEIVYAPFDGKVINVTGTKHALGLCSNDGIELLIHIGVDTVSMNGNGFTVYVCENETVKCGQKLMKFSKTAIKSAGFPDTTAIIITNTDSYAAVNICAENTVNSSDKIITVAPN
ncbi:MAG: PTS sugar transporter subunit IIA [Anaerotignaceae bacterium]